MASLIVEMVHVAFTMDHTVPESGEVVLNSKHEPSWHHMHSAKSLDRTRVGQQRVVNSVHESSPHHTRHASVGARRLLPALPRALKHILILIKPSQSSCQLQ